MGFIYQIRYFPEPGRQYSPQDFINGLTDKGEQARIKQHHDSLRCLYPQYWQEHLNIKLIVKGLYQLTSGPIRSYICIDGGILVVVYMCRKVKGKIRLIDKRRAINNMNRYFEGRND